VLNVDDDDDDEDVDDDDVNENVLDNDGTDIDDVVEEDSVNPVGFVTFSIVCKNSVVIFTLAVVTFFSSSTSSGCPVVDVWLD
jgi:hypothetical protein